MLWLRLAICGAVSYATGRNERADILCLQVFKHIFLGPSAGLAGPGETGRSTRPGNATLGGATECTPAMIAYACVQVRHSS